MTGSRLKLIFLVVALLASALGVTVAHYSSKPAEAERALVLGAPRALPDFHLLDHNGANFDRSRLEGRWSFLFFGFTNCPDVCPSTLFTLETAMEELGGLPENARPAVIMVSVDPNRDTVDKLAGYLPYFDPEFLGVTGEMPEVMKLTASMGVAFSYVPSASGGNTYTVDHTASIFLVDPQGRLAAVFGTPHEASVLASDFRRILAGRG